MARSTPSHNVTTHARLGSRWRRPAVDTTAPAPPTAGRSTAPAPPTAGRSTAPGLAIAALATALLLAGCSGDDEVVIEDGVGATDVGEEQDQDAGAEADPDPGEEDATDGEDTAAQDVDEQDQTEQATGATPPHSPPSPVDCTSVSEPSPGAVILFPDANDPGTLQAGTGPVTVEVAGCSDTFEANLQYEAFHGQNTTPTLSGFTSGGTLGDWEAFSISETYWTPGDWTVVVFENDAESGNRVEYDEVTFTVD